MQGVDFFELLAVVDPAHGFTGIGVIHVVFFDAGALIKLEAATNRHHAHAGGKGIKNDVGGNIGFVPLAIGGTLALGHTISDKDVRGGKGGGGRRGIPRHPTSDQYVATGAEQGFEATLEGDNPTQAAGAFAGNNSWSHLLPPTSSIVARRG
jgi:hypothetical protein